MTFQALDLRGKHFLDLLNSKLHYIKLFYTKRVLGSNTSDTLIYCVQEPLEPFLIILQ